LLGAEITNITKRIKDAGKGPVSKLFKARGGDKSLFLFKKSTRRGSRLQVAGGTAWDKRNFLEAGERGGVHGGGGGKPLNFGGRSFRPLLERRLFLLVVERAEGKEPLARFVKKKKDAALFPAMGKKGEARKGNFGEDWGDRTCTTTAFQGKAGGSPVTEEFTAGIMEGRRRIKKKWERNLLAARAMLLEGECNSRRGYKNRIRKGAGRRFNSLSRNRGNKLGKGASSSLARRFNKVTNAGGTGKVKTGKENRKDSGLRYVTLLHAGL